MVPPATTHTRRARLLSSFTPVLLALGLSVSLGTGLGSVTAGSTAPAGELRLAAAALVSPSYTTFTLNIRHDMRKAKARADMIKAFTLGDVGGLQEMSELEDRQTLIELAQERDWGWYMPNDGGVAIPIIWKRERFRMIDGRTIRTHGPENKVTPSRYINVVRLRELATGKVFGFINTHTIAQASYDAQASDMRRIPRLRKHLRMLRREIIRLSASTEHVFATGDLNVNYLADRRRQVAGLPTDALGGLVSFDMPLEGSRGPTSLLDYGMTLKEDSGLQLTESQIVRGFHSDHDAVVFTYDPVDLFTEGPLFNEPTAAKAGQHRVLSRATRAVMNAESGAEVRLLTSRVDHPALANALLGAHAEGVAVRVVLGGGRPTEAEERLAAALGSDPAASSFVVRCAGTCQGGDGQQETNVLLVSRAGGTTDLSLVSSGPFVSAGASRWTDLLRSSDAGVYAGYLDVFENMYQAPISAPAERSARFGAVSAQLYPVAAGDKDPMLRALTPVKCKNARGLRTDDGRTNVRVLARSWSGERGLQIARRLGVLKGRGCDVVAVLGPQVKRGVQRSLKASGIPTRRAATGQQLLVVDGRYAKRNGVSLAWTGGPSWTDRGLGSDGVTLVVPWASTVQAYLDGFSRTWRNG